MLKSIKVKICYDSILQKTTGMAFTEAVLSEGSTFTYLLMNIFMEHPEIEMRYPPGTLGIMINKIPIKIDHPLSDGDVVELIAATADYV